LLAWAWSGPFTYSSLNEAINTQICALSLTSFVLAYYDNSSSNPYTLTTKVGKYDTSTAGSITWSSALQFPNVTSPTASVACPSSNSFVLSYYGNHTVDATLVKIDGTSLSISATDSVRGVSPTNFFASVALSPSVVVVAFDDTRRDFSYMASVLNVFSFGLIDFGGLEHLNAGAGGAAVRNLHFTLENH